MARFYRDSRELCTLQPDPPVTLGRIPQWTHIMPLVSRCLPRGMATTLPLNILAPARPSPRSVLQWSEEGCYSADQTYASVVIRAFGGLLTTLPRAVNRAVWLICAFVTCYSAACHPSLRHYLYYPAGSYLGERAGNHRSAGIGTALSLPAMLA